MQPYKGQTTEGYNPTAFIEVPNDSSADFAVKMFSSDLEPEYPMGCILLVEKTCDVSDGDIIVVLIGEDLLCRRIYEDSFGNLYLVGSGGQSVMVRQSDTDRIICVGRVIGKKELKKI